ncbi:MAG: S49 family peptidase [Phycisphaerales bacterium JB039]
MKRMLCAMMLGAVGLTSPAALAQGEVRLGLLELKGTPTEAPNPFAWLIGTDGAPTLREVTDAITEAGASGDHDALVVRLKDAELGMAHVDEIGAAMRAARAAGTPVYVFAEMFGPTGLMLGAHADGVFLQQGSMISLPGLYMEEMYLADTLDWIGMKADLIQVGDYKGASEQMTRSEPSDAWDQNISHLLDSMYGHMTGTIAEGRGLSSTQMDRAMEIAWWAEGEEAIEAGLIDQVVDLPDLGDRVAAAMDQDTASVQWETVAVGAGGQSLDTANPFAILSMLSSTPTHKPRRSTIAVLHIDGVIVDGDSTPESMFSSPSTGSRTIRNTIAKIAKEDLIEGVIVRISSPGGSAIASEVIWQGLRELAETKPVWVSVGSMAASGGYYIAVSGDRIWVDPSSIVGSIGVVGGKISMGELYDTLKINVVSRSRGPRADMFASDQPWDEDQRELVRRKLEQTYELFTERVRSGRPGIDLSRTAEGRLFLGEEAVELRMADDIGGLSDAAAAMASELGLSDPDLMHYPGPKSFQEMMEEMFGGFVQAPVGSASPALAGVREVLGEDLWAMAVEAATQLRQLRDEPALLIMPRVIRVK